jgi:hypothetical protein
MDKMIFNIYYMNFAKVYEIKMILSNIIKIGQEVEKMNQQDKVKEIDSQLVTADEKEKKMLEKERDEILNIVDDLNDYHKWITDNGIKLRGMWFNLE